jgi:hypothetical protein
MNQDSECGFAVIYRWKVAESQVEQFKGAWEIVTKEIRDHEGGLGSRLHKASDGTWIAYAQWPNREKWKSANVTTEEGKRALEILTQAVEERLPPILLDPVADYLVHAKRGSMRVSALHGRPRADGAILTPELERALNELFVKARREGVLDISAERLLLGLLGDAEVQKFLASSGAKIETLIRAAETALSAEIDQEAAAAALCPSGDATPTQAFQRVLQRAFFQIQRSRHEQLVTAMHLLAAILEEGASKAAGMLEREGIERMAVIRRMADSRRHDPAESETRGGGQRLDLPGRLDDIEAKLDGAIDTLGKLSTAVHDVLARLPPRT